MEWNFDNLDHLSAISVGVPGKRTFFLAIGNRTEWLRVWLEKQDLQAIALAMRQLLLKLSINYSNPSKSGVQRHQSSSGLPTAELELSEVQLGYQDGSVVLDLVTAQLGLRKTERSTIHLSLTLSQLGEFASEAERLCAAGRPICPLCGGPIDPSGHLCPSRN